jgi:uncharacterized protein YggU (UPF0235/DUF167 family)
VDGEANQALVVFLAAALGVAARDVRIVSGNRGRVKTIEVEGIDRARLNRLASLP